MGVKRKGYRVSAWLSDDIGETIEEIREASDGKHTKSSALEFLVRLGKVRFDALQELDLVEHMSKEIVRLKAKCNETI